MIRPGLSLSRPAASAKRRAGCFAPGLSAPGLSALGLLLLTLAATPAKGEQPCPDPAAADTQGRITLTAHDGPMRLRLQTGGHGNLHHCDRHRGGGFVERAPDLLLNLASNTAGRDLSIDVTGRCDPFVLLRDPAGHWHDSRRTERADRLVLSAPGRGDHMLWLGNGFGRCDGQVTVTMVEGARDRTDRGRCPDPAATPALGSRPLRVLMDHLTTGQLQAGGPVALAQCPSIRSRGRVASAPSLRLEIPRFPPVALLTLTASGQCPATILALDPAGRWHAGDTARLELRGPPQGIYRIWLGTVSHQTCSVRLRVEQRR